VGVDSQPCYCRNEPTARTSSSALLDATPEQHGAVVLHTLARFVLTIYHEIAGVESEADEGNATSPPPPIRPLQLAALARRNFGDLLDNSRASSGAGTKRSA
jgi:hypothetical protein